MKLQQMLLLQLQHKTHLPKLLIQTGPEAISNSV